MSGRRHDSPQPAQTVTGYTANRRDVLRNATGVAAAAAIGTTLADRGGVAFAGSVAQIRGEIVGLGQFDVLALSWGLSNSATVVGGGGGGGVGKASFQDLSFTKLTDALSPLLMVAVASGRHFTRATMTYLGKGGETILRLQLDDLLVTSLSEGFSLGSDVTENVTLNFAKVTFTYGTSTGSWDIVEGKGS